MRMNANSLRICQVLPTDRELRQIRKNRKKSHDIAKYSKSSRIIADIRKHCSKRCPLDILGDTFLRFCFKTAPNGQIGKASVQTTNGRPQTAHAQNLAHVGKILTKSPRLTKLGMDSLCAAVRLSVTDNGAVHITTLLEIVMFKPACGRRLTDLIAYHLIEHSLARKHSIMKHNAIIILVPSTDFGVRRRQKCLTS
eukprot:sb/3470900/